MQLRELRVAKGLSQRTLARITGITQPHICQLENGHIHDTSLRTAARLAQALDLPLETIVLAIASSPTRRAADYALPVPEPSVTP